MSIESTFSKVCILVTDKLLESDLYYATAGKFLLSETEEANVQELVRELKMPNDVMVAPTIHQSCFRYAH